MKTRTKKWLAMALSLLVLTAALVFATRLLTPKRFDYGSTWGQYLKEPKNSIDAMFFGTSQVYCDVIPAVIWEKSGLRTYVTAGAEQTMPITYYTVLEALKTQSPQAVLVDVTSLIYPTHTTYTQINLGYFPNGAAKWQAVRAEAEEGQLPGYLFPLYFYHSRWDELTEDDWRVAFGGYGADPLAGFTYLDGYVPMDGTKVRTISQEPAVFERNFSYLEKIATLCREKQITPVFFLTPTHAVLPDVMHETIADRVQALDGVLWYDFNADYEAFGIDESRDCFDLLHFNSAGAEKFSVYLSDFLTQTLSLTPTGAADDALWQSRAEHWAALRQKPLEPIQKESP